MFNGDLKLVIKLIENVCFITHFYRSQWPEGQVEARRNSVVGEGIFYFILRVKNIPLMSFQ